MACLARAGRCSLPFVTYRCLWLLIWLSIRLFALCCAQEATDDASNSPQCAVWSGAECAWEPNLQTMKVDFGPKLQETFSAYVTPDVAEFYNETAGSRKAVAPAFAGLFGKFVNLSRERVLLFWNPGRGGQPSLHATVEPFGSTGTASYPGHRFYFAPEWDRSKILQRWTIEAGNSLYYYDPYGSTAAAVEALQPSEVSFYQMQLQNRVFAEQYRAFTGTDWLALYKYKRPPQYHMWRADFFGQTHIVETKEIHFVEQPPDIEITRGMSMYGPRPDETQRMRRYRDTHPTLSLELKVLSCAPRVFEIRNFLSDVEIEHILRIAKSSELHRSTVRASSSDSEETVSETRTSSNSWIARSKDFMIDAIYKRAADVLGMNEALLRARRKTELEEFKDSTISVAERLQLVHYTKGAQYTPHHDFAMPGLVNLQPSRFATILFYLNDDMEGGETSFPRWLNAETSEPLKVSVPMLMLLLPSLWSASPLLPGQA